MEKPVGVTKDILETFLSKVRDEDLSDEVINALRRALIEDGKSNEKALVEAIFPESES